MCSIKVFQFLQFPSFSKFKTARLVQRELKLVRKGDY